MTKIKKKINKKTVKKEPGPPGRPTLFSDELANSICELIAGGEKEPMSLREVCRRKGMPSVTSVCKWLSENEEFAKQYARARTRQADWYFDEIDKIARECPAVMECINRARLRIDTLKWKLARMNPKKYGDKIDVDHTGVNPLADLLREIRSKSGGFPFENDGNGGKS